MNNDDLTKEFFRRLMEGYDSTKASQFKAGSRVVLIRPLLYPDTTIPVGTEGVIKAIMPDESIMASKGRPFEVEFDLTGYNIPLDPDFRKSMIESGLSESSLPEHYHRLTTYLGPYDIDLAAG